MDNNPDAPAEMPIASPSSADATREKGQHDPYCPKLYPTRTVIDAETGDLLTWGHSKFLCQCDVLAAVRALDGGETALRAAYMRGRLETPSDGQ